jgi:hypothetical protein
VALAQIPMLNYGPTLEGKNIPHIFHKCNSFGLMIRSKDPIFGMQPGESALSYKLMHFGKYKMATMPLFWMDSWKQLPHCKQWTIYAPYQDHIQGLEHLKVVDLWLNVSHHPPWRSWKMLPQDLHLPTDCDLQPWQTIVGKRKICISEEMDILHWGYTPSRMFTIKEAYHLQENFHNHASN